MSAPAQASAAVAARVTPAGVDGATGSNPVTLWPAAMRAAA